MTKIFKILLVAAAAAMSVTALPGLFNRNTAADMLQVRNSAALPMRDDIREYPAPLARSVAQELAELEAREPAKKNCDGKCNCGSGCSCSGCAAATKEVDGKQGMRRPP
ncbi:hypothetical protein B0H63DRAFT_537746 [Podospora didyma]|uniref:Uncharacterized protein n=1 Tax=Podospora didyma TaxID=330526 RepID=A0AAE0NY03_9PEZI|nr:hypothetical protein B0H63DRAFT_537746 [Podospora didyma]